MSYFASKELNLIDFYLEKIGAINCISLEVFQLFQKFVVYLNTLF